MAGRIATLADHGAQVLGPPVKWRPRQLTTKEKLEIVVRQLGKEPGGARLNPLDGVQFDHDPALQRRRWDEQAKDTIPPSCALDFIIALNKPTHGIKTANVDVPEIAKLKRLEGRAGQKKPKRKIPGQKLRSRPLLKLNRGFR
ncbi:hypothetical protein [Mesorhizobium sp. M7A.F.Ca.MR.148.00.0.0]|uniref:hypothetical protein n=1 Tax=Mesorhizobium sp. M7A.F.Ca.MR.148.00.0.0 TaxID=2496775 RepID=UPI000FCA9E8F|nr:hypothetical protein [Mesorhizobium sp. M7A.F.Ca.MR.148.00.0.0]RUV37460.1 hypothetical protein EOB49_11925 [Mesorhizobium sp. M7A.F.Ca.MR.148.00.0.0]